MTPLCNGERSSSSSGRGYNGAEQEQGGYLLKKEDGVDEARRPIALHGPRMPSKREVEEHELTHIPFRSWCNNCMRGRGVKKGHRTRDKSEEDNEPVP